MDQRRAYEDEVLATFSRLASRAPEISDADRDSEYRAQRIFFAALAGFRSEVESARALTGLRKDALDDLLDTLCDATPNALAWDEAIADARRGW